jgi:regulator of replication initiation timing
LTNFVFDCSVGSKLRTSSSHSRRGISESPKLLTSSGRIGQLRDDDTALYSQKLNQAFKMCEELQKVLSEVRSFSFSLSLSLSLSFSLFNGVCTNVIFDCLSEIYFSLSLRVYVDSLNSRIYRLTEENEKLRQNLQNYDEKIRILETENKQLEAEVQHFKEMRSEFPLHEMTLEQLKQTRNKIKDLIVRTFHFFFVCVVF